MLLSLAAFTADNEQIVTDLPFRLGKKASLSLANVAWYVMHVVQSRSSVTPVQWPDSSSLYSNSALA